jgi:hypothetical protein
MVRGGLGPAQVYSHGFIRAVNTNTQCLYVPVCCLALCLFASWGRVTCFTSCFCGTLLCCDDCSPVHDANLVVLPSPSSSAPQGGLMCSWGLCVQVPFQTHVVCCACCCAGVLPCLCRGGQGSFRRASTSTSNVPTSVQDWTTNKTSSNAKQHSHCTRKHALAVHRRTSQMGALHWPLAQTAARNCPHPCFAPAGWLAATVWIAATAAHSSSSQPECRSWATRLNQGHAARHARAATRSATFTRTGPTQWSRTAQTLAGSTAG